MILSTVDFSQLKRWRLCFCGCGRPTPLAIQTKASLGYIGGQPVGNLPGHSPKGIAHKIRLAAKRYADNKKYEAQRNLQYVKNNRDKVNARRRARYAANPSRWLGASKQWKIANHSAVKAGVKRWLQANPEAKKIYSARRSAHKAKALGAFSLIEWNAKKAQFGGKCIDCRKPKKLTIGHAVPLSKGGSNFIGNIIPQCKNCNSRQHDAIHASVIGASLFERIRA